MDYDQSPILSHTGYSYDEMKQFLRFHMRWLRRISTALTAFYCGCVLLLAVILRSRREPMSELIPWFIYLILFVFMLCYSYGLVFTKKAYEKQIRLFRNGQRFTFRNRDFTVENEQSDFAGQTMMHYASLHKVVETNDMFYLYLSRRQAYLVSKQGFLAAGPGRLRPLLRQSLPPEKYKVRITYQHT